MPERNNRNMAHCEAEKVDGKWVCQAKKCPHRREGGGCSLGKVSLSCDNDDCRFNVEGHCLNMNVHLDADGKCLGERK